jgi:cellulose synthase/poly-beta-1,6-N-acetylglucosamine synthase-like glycosyltransferase
MRGLDAGMISVIVRTLDNAATLPACLGALVPAAVDAIVTEVIVVDGGSTDATLEIVEDAGAKRAAASRRRWRRRRRLAVAAAGGPAAGGRLGGGGGGASADSRRTRRTVPVGAMVAAAAGRSAGAAGEEGPVRGGLGADTEAR